MNLLIKDTVSAAGATIARDLAKMVGHRTSYAVSADDMLKQLEAEKDAIGIIVLFLDMNPEAGLALVHDIREFCSLSSIRCPRFLILAPGNLAPGYRVKFRAHGARCIAFGFPDELYATTREMIFEATCESGRVTIVVERRSGGTRFWLLGPAGRELIAIGPRQTGLMNYFAINFGTELSTVELAEAIDTSIACIRVYLDRLRERFDEAAKRIGLPVAGKDVFCTLRKDGGFVHVLRARVLFC